VNGIDRVVAVSSWFPAMPGREESRTDHSLHRQPCHDGGPLVEIS
jgi:hypothetical protein